MMAPQTRSRGKTPASRVYNSSPAPQQLQFPARRRVVKTYSRKSAAEMLRQTTITQIDFLRQDMLDEDETEDRVDDGRHEEEEEEEEEEEADDDDVILVSARKRKTKQKREASTAASTRRKRRRKTEGDVPDEEPDHMPPKASSGYRDQTLTQAYPEFISSGQKNRLEERPGLDRRTVIKDSEDESEDDLVDFLEMERGGKAARGSWAAAGAGAGAGARISSSSPTRVGNSPTAAAPRSKGNLLLLPQTPSKQRKMVEIPSSQPSPYTPLLARYSPAPRQSPLRSRSTNVGSPMPPPSAKTPSLKMKGNDQEEPRTATRTETKTATRRVLEVKDSYASSSWPSSAGQAPASWPLPGAPTDMRQTGGKDETSEDSEKENRTPAEEDSDSGIVKPRREVREIADSEDDGDDFTDIDEDNTLMPLEPTTDRNVASQELGEFDLTTAKDLRNTSPDNTSPTEDREIEQIEGQPKGGNPKSKGRGARDEYPVGADTQIAFDFIASGQDEEETWDPESITTTSTKSAHKTTQANSSADHLPSPSATTKTPLALKKVRMASTSPRVNFESEERSPAEHRTQAYTQMNSQRLDLDEIREMPEVSFNSDAFISMHPDTMARFLRGTKNHDFRKWRLPGSVVRVWLYITKPESRVRYMARVGGIREPGDIVDEVESGAGNAEFNRGEKKGYKYAIALTEFYELNNPVSLAKMKAQGWLSAPPHRFSIVPPAVASQLLSNLRCRLDVGADPDETQDEDDEHDEYGDLVPDSQAPGDEDKTVSQQVAAQLHSDFVQSTQHYASTGQNLEEEEEEVIPSSQTPTRPRNDRKETEDDGAPSPSTGAAERRKTRSSSDFIAPQLPATRRTTRASGGMTSAAAGSVAGGARNTMAPSQATTTSAASTPSPQKPPAAAGRRGSDGRPSEESIASIGSSLPNFHDSGSPARVPEGDFGLRSSQLVTVSQLLPESLLADHAPPRPPVVWDSEDDVEDEL